MAEAKAQAEAPAPPPESVSSRTRSGRRKRPQSPSKPGEINVLDLAESPTASSRGSPRSPPPVAADGSALPVVSNVVATVNLGTTLDLNDVARRARNCEYKPSRFSAVVMRIRDPRTTALIFRTGKIVVTGARSEQASKLAARKFARIIRKLGYTDATMDDWKCENMVANIQMGCKINLHLFARKAGPLVRFEPELFPGLVYKIPTQSRQRVRGNDNKKNGMVLLVFSNGSVVITGATQKNEIYESFALLKPVILSFKREPLGNSSGDISDE